MSEDNQRIGHNPQLSNDFLSLGFDPDSGEWEMLVENNPNITIGQLVRRYLYLARSNYNANWNTIDDAVNDDTGINKRNIIRDVLASYSPRTPSGPPPSFRFSPSSPSGSSPSFRSFHPSTDSMDTDPNSNTMSDDYVDNKGPIPAAGGKRRKTRRRKTKKRKSRRSRKSRRYKR